MEARRFTDEEKNAIKRLREQGRSYKEIAKELNTTIFAVRYHLQQKFRQEAIRRSKERIEKMRAEGKLVTNEREREYMREYMNKRYHTDEDFRRKMIDMSQRYQRRKAEERREMRAMIALQNATKGV